MAKNNASAVIAKNMALRNIQKDIQTAQMAGAGSVVAKVPEWIQNNDQKKIVKPESSNIVLDTSKRLENNPTFPVLEATLPGEQLRDIAQTTGPKAPLATLPWSASAQRKAAEQEYEAYMGSEENKKNQQEANRRALENAIKQVLSVPGASFSDAPLKMYHAEDPKEKALKAQVDYFENQVILEDNAAVTEKALAGYESWSEEDKKNLDLYIADALSPRSDNPWAFLLPKNPLIEKYGEDTVKRMAEARQRQSNEEFANQVVEDTQRRIKENPISGGIAESAVSVGAGLVGALTTPISYLADANLRTGQYKTLDPNTAGGIFNTYSGAVREQVTENIRGDGESWLRNLAAVGYQGGMNAADNAARLLASGGSAGISAALAASGSFGSALQRYSAQGASPEQAAAMAVVSAGLEYATEKLPTEKVLELFKGGSKKDVIGKVLAQAFLVEPTSEEVNLFAGVAAEAALLGDKNSQHQKIGEMVANGMSYQEASAEYWKGLWKEAAETYAVSAISGGMSAGGAAVLGNIVNGRSAQETPQAEPAPDYLEVTGEQLAQQAPQQEVQPVTPEMEQLDMALAETIGMQPVQQSTVDTTPQATQPSTDDSTVINTDPAQHSPQEQSVIHDYQNAVDDNLVEYIQTVKDNPGQRLPRYPLNNVSDRAAADIQRLTGIDVAGNKTQIEARTVEHILKRHGENGNADHSMRDVNDIGRIQYVIDNYDSMEHGGTTPAYRYQDADGKQVHSQTVLIKKKVNGTYFVVEAVPDTKKKTLYVLSAYMNKNGQKETASSLVGDAEAYRVTSETKAKSDAVYSDTNVPTNIVSNRGRNVNQNNQSTPTADNQTAVQMGASNAPGQSAEGGQPGIKGTGAAEANYSGRAKHQEMLSDENSQPDRPGDVRPMEVLRTDPYGRRVTDFAADAYGAEVTSDRMADTIQELIQDGALGFDTRSNRESLENAALEIEKRGDAATRTKITKAVMSGKIQDGDIEQALLLYAKYAGKEGKRAQDYSAELMVDLSTMANMAGRNLQLFKLLRRMTPQGQLMAVQKNVGRYVDSLNEGRSRRNRAEVEIPPELERAFMTATSDDERQAISEDIYKSVAAQIKPTLGEMWDAWRNLAMLGNVKTHLRNIAGSAAFRPYESVKRAIGAGIENLMVDQENRTKAVLGSSEEAKALKAWAKEDGKSDAVKSLMEYSGTTGNEARNAIEEHRQILPGWADKARKGNMALMEGADMRFKQREYTLSMASFLKARGYTAEQLQKGEVPQGVLNEGRKIAVQEAMKATFNDRNRFSNAVAGLRAKGNDGWSKAINTVAKGILPFTRTPANVVVRAVEYSPVGIANSLVTLTKKVKSGEATVSQGIDQLAAGLTGTGAMLLGGALSAGLIPKFRLIGEASEEEKRKGAKDYSLQMGDDYYEIEWLAPANIPLFIGANLYSNLKAKEEAGEDIDAWDWLSALAETGTDALNPMLELSMLSSLNDIISNVAYEETPGDKALAFLSSAATSYFTQGLPTIFGQMEQATEKNKSTVFANADNPLERSFQRTVGSATQRIPGIDLFQIDKVDEFGNVVENEGNILQRAVNAMLNPANISKGKEGPVLDEINRLSAAQPDSVDPPTIPKSISYTDGSGERHTGYRLSGEEYETLQKVQGQTVQTLLESCISDPAYQAMTDAQKAKVFDYAYDYAREYARAEALPGYEFSGGWMDSVNPDNGRGIIQKVVNASFTDAFETFTSGGEGAAEELEQAMETFQKLGAANRHYFKDEATGRVKYFLEASEKGVSAETFLDLYGQYRSIDQSGQTTTEKAHAWANALDKATQSKQITGQQKEVLKESMGFRYSMKAETEKYDQMVESGIKPDTAIDLQKLVADLEPQKSYSSVRDVQKAEAIANAKSISDADKVAVLKLYLSDAQDKNLDDMLAMGYDAQDYARAYAVYAGVSSGAGKKNRIIAGLQSEFGIDRATATAIYKVYGG